MSGTTWDMLWALWAILFFVTFLGIEIPAYQEHHTLSATIRRVIGIGQHMTWYYRLFRIVLVMVLVWLLIHLTTGFM